MQSTQTVRFDKLLEAGQRSVQLGQGPLSDVQPRRQGAHLG